MPIEQNHNENQPLVSSVKPHKKLELRDVEFFNDLLEVDLSVRAFSHVYAVDRRFERVKFDRSNWSNCYFRNCNFIECDFSGVTFKECSFKGSRFGNCKFRYTFWDKTIVDESILDECNITEVNLARDVVRSLRVNFSQLGNQDAVNKAILLEISLTGRHLRNIAFPRTPYYVDLAAAENVIESRFRLFWWALLEVLCGHGERPWNVVGAILLLPALLSIAIWSIEPQHDLFQFVQLLSESYSSFFGIELLSLNNENASVSKFIYSVVFPIFRFLLPALLMASFIKRLMRR